MFWFFFKLGLLVLTQTRTLLLIKLETCCVLWSHLRVSRKMKIIISVSPVKAFKGLKTEGNCLVAHVGHFFKT